MYLRQFENITGKNQPFIIDVFELYITEVSGLLHDLSVFNSEYESPEFKLLIHRLILYARIMDMKESEEILVQTEKNLRKKTFNVNSICGKIDFLIVQFQNKMDWVKIQIEKLKNEK